MHRQEIDSQRRRMHKLCTKFQRRLGDSQERVALLQREADSHRLAWSIVESTATALFRAKLTEASAEAASRWRWWLWTGAGSGISTHGDCRVAHSPRAHAQRGGAVSVEEPPLASPDQTHFPQRSLPRLNRWPSWGIGGWHMRLSGKTLLWLRTRSTLRWRYWSTSMQCVLCVRVLRVCTFACDSRVVSYDG